MLLNILLHILLIPLYMVHIFTEIFIEIFILSLSSQMKWTRNVIKIILLDFYYAINQSITKTTHEELIC